MWQLSGAGTAAAHLMSERHLRRPDDEDVITGRAPERYGRVRR